MDGFFFFYSRDGETPTPPWETVSRVGSECLAGKKHSDTLTFNIFFPGKSSPSPHINQESWLIPDTRDVQNANNATTEIKQKMTELLFPKEERNGGRRGGGDDKGVSHRSVKYFTYSRGRSLHSIKGNLPPP